MILSGRYNVLYSNTKIFPILRILFYILNRVFCVLIFPIYALISGIQVLYILLYDLNYLNLQNVIPFTSATTLQMPEIMKHVKGRIRIKRNQKHTYCFQSSGLNPIRYFLFIFNCRIDEHRKS